MRLLQTRHLTAEEYAACGDDEARLALLGDGSNTPRKERKKRTQQDRLTNPYEWEIQRATVKLLKQTLADGYFVRAHAPEREGESGGLYARRNGQVPGCPDLDVMGDGRLWVLEMKDKSGRLKAIQRETQARIRRAGIPVLDVCRSAEHAVAWLRENGARFKVGVHV
jgi:hypothetical protein